MSKSLEIETVEAHRKDCRCRLLLRLAKARKSCTAASRSIGPNAGREYQQAHDASVIGSMRSVDLSKTRVSCALLAEPLTERHAKPLTNCAPSRRKCSGALVTLVSALSAPWLAQRRPLEETGAPGRRSVVTGAD